MILPFLVSDWVVQHKQERDCESGLIPMCLFTILLKAMKPKVGHFSCQL